MAQPIYDSGSNLDDADGSKLQERALTQEEVITEFFNRHKGRPYTPWEVWRALGQQYEITSVRRGLSNLTDKGILQKREDIRKEGEKDVKNNTWVMPSKVQLEFF